MVQNPKNSQVQQNKEGKTLGEYAERRHTRYNKLANNDGNTHLNTLGTGEQNPGNQRMAGKDQWQEVENKTRGMDRQNKTGNN